MAQDFGNGVSRTLSAAERQFLQVVWLASTPPLDSDLNLSGQIDTEALQNYLRSNTHSGFFMDPLSTEKDYQVNPAWSNWFKLGRPVEGDVAPVLWANVNGWVIPVTGSNVAEGDASNRVNLFPPPTTDARIDLIFLEVWQAQVSPNPSTLNKPSASTIYKYGNVKYGGVNLPDDLQDPTLGYQTTKRVQIQYRLRVVGQGAGLGASVDLAQYPEGLDDPNVLAQGAQAAAVAGYTFTNMRAELGDAGLWRAGAGDEDSRTDLGTVDGYVYAIPVCAVFRRNTGLFVALSNSGNANQNGSFNRNPIVGAVTDPVQATRTFTSVTLTSALDASTTGVVSVTGLTGSGLDNVNLNWGATVLQVGGEILTVSAVNAAGGTITIASRGRFGTQASRHAAGETVQFYTFRPDGRFADEVALPDILDLRHAVSLGSLSFEGLLQHNLKKILSGDLRTSFKQGNGSDTQGTQLIEVDTYLGRLAGTLPNQTEQLDGFDGVRTIFSDASVMQSDVSLLLTPSGGSVVVSANTWGVAPDFNVSGFLPTGASEWENGAIIRLFLGGATGSSGARATSQSGDRFMRFVSPQELWLSRDQALKSGSTQGLQTPFLMRFVGDGTTAPQAWSLPAGLGDDATDHPGPMFPLPDRGFLTPFAVLGGVVNTSLAYASATVISGGVSLAGAGVNFDTAGVWVDDPTDPQVLSTVGITSLLLQGTRNLYDLLTAGGTDLTGQSSELFLVLQDNLNPTNQGLFRVVGAGTIGYTTQSSGVAGGLVLSPVGTATLAVTGATVSVEVRSLYMNTEDGPGSALASACIVITDLAATVGGEANPWNSLSSATIGGDMVLDTSLLYGPSRGAMARLPDALLRFALENPVGVSLLREAPENKDPSPLDIRNRTGAPEDEYYFSPQPFQTWNRLPSLGLHAPKAPAYGEGKYNFETRRESELLVDVGSKTVVFRPFQQVLMSLPVREMATSQLPAFYDDGITPVDGANLFPDKTVVLDTPPEYMPRFGRQDIPVRASAASGGPYFGIGHLFGDDSVLGADTLNIVGGTTSNTSLKIVTGVSSGLSYGEYSVGQGWYQGRIYTDVNARSSDINKVLRGIQLPPYLGVARVYGVYDKRDYDTNGSAWLDRGFTPDTGVAKGTNLLRTNADKQTLFIVKDGAEDVIAGKSAHTYLIPEEAVDITLSPEFISGESFEDIEFVVEVSVFGFAQGFLTQNNYVLSRSALTEQLLSNVRMVIPAPMPGGVRGYSAYLRTVYQGDPYMTRDASTLQAADYEHRYGAVPVASAFAVQTPVQQYDVDNVQVPEIPNPRALQVLASVDFWTTLGTGKIAGPVFAGTPSDVGFLASPGVRIPDSGTANPYQPTPRAFTEGQPDDGEYAALTVVLLDNASLAGESITLQREGTSVTLTAVAGVPGDDEFQVGSDAAASARALATAINASDLITLELQVYAIPRGNTVQIQAMVSGTHGRSTYIITSDSDVFWLDVPTYRGHVKTRSPLLGGVDIPVNALVGSGSTPARLTGMTDRLPLGILVSDSDFLGEDPQRKGFAYRYLMGGQAATGLVSTFNPDGTPTDQGGVLGLADGAVLQYSAYNAVSAPDGTRRFRIYRGGGAAYSLSADVGAPLDFMVEGFEAGATLKGAVLAGRAYLVRNQVEEAFAGTSVRSYGDELQILIVTSAVYGEGANCPHGYVLDGIHSPTDYGKGYTAADRYRLEGKPLVKSVASLPDADVALIPYPPQDPASDDPCA